MFAALNPSQYYTMAVTFGGILLITAILVYVVFGVPASNTPTGRIEAIRKRREKLKKGKLQPVTKKKKDSKPLVSDSVAKKVALQVYQPKDEQISELALKLSRAGVRDRGAVFRHMFFKLMWTALTPIGTFLLIFFILKPSWSMTTSMGIVGISMVLGLLLPDIMLKHKIDKRMLPIKRAFPDALDMLVVCAESGLSIDAAIKRVSGEMHSGSPELAEELALTGVELGFFEDRREALNNLSRRVNLPTVRAFVNTMIQTEKYGTPVAHSLRILSAEFRQERMMEAEAKASQLPAKLTVPLILCILPPLMIVLIGPAIIQAMDAFRASGVNQPRSD